MEEDIIDNKIKDYTNKGVSNYENGNYDKAIEYFNKVLELNPNYAEIYFARGSIFDAKENYTSAIADYTKAIKLNRNYIEAYFNRADTYHKKKDYDNAIIDYTMAIYSDPNDEIFYFNRAEVYKDAKDYDKAIADYTVAIYLDSDYADAYKNRGDSFYNKELYDKAIADYDKAINLDSNNKESYFNRGITYHNKELYDKAIADYDKAIHLDINDKDIYNNRGIAYHSKKDYDKAIADYSKAIQLDPNFTNAYNNRGVAYHNKDDYDKAITDYSKAIQLNPNFTLACDNLKSITNTSIFIPLTPQMVLVEGGTFQMGDTFGDGESDEKPVHEIRLTYDFYIGKYTVTQKEYESLMKTNPSHWKGDNLPVEQVTWFDAIKYCNALSKKEALPLAYDEITGNLLDSNSNVTIDVKKVMGYRLPTEAEWEYSARGANKSQGYRYSGSDDIYKVAWYIANSGYETHAVGSKQANELGLYDMSGNVWEWCTDWYGNYTVSRGINIYIYKDSDFRVVRGGSWYISANYVRISNRSSNMPYKSNYNLGFRLVRTK